MLTTQTVKIPFDTIEDLIAHKGKPQLMVPEATAIDVALKVHTLLSNVLARG